MTRSPAALGCALALLAGCGGPPARPVRVSAAASTREVLEQVARDFEAAAGTPVACNFGPSSALARQIEQGEDADLFLSADQEWADYLARRNLVAGRRDLLTNRLVVAAPADSPLA